MALCMCSSLRQVVKAFTQAWAAASIAKPGFGHFGRYLHVRNRASENGLSLLTRGRGGAEDYLPRRQR
jgi:hypothetical protein